jgi:hypothetical protein
MQFFSSRSATQQIISGVLAVGLGLTSMIAWSIDSVADPTPAVPASSNPPTTAPVNVSPSPSNSASTAASTAPTPEQIVQIDQKLQGTWSLGWEIDEKIKDENTSFVFRVAVNSNREIEAFFYRFGRLFKYSVPKMKYRVKGIQNVKSLQLVELELSYLNIKMGEATQEHEGSAAMVPEDFKATWVISMQGDRKISLHSLNGKYSDPKDITKSKPGFRKISDNIEIADHIPFKANDPQTAQDEVENNLDIVLKSQESYRLTHPKYAADFNQLPDVQDLAKGNEFYSYRITNIGSNRTIVKVIPKVKELKSYVGMIYSRSGQTLAMKTCGSDRPKLAAMANPILKSEKRYFRIYCPKGSREIIKPDIIVFDYSW